MTEYIVQSGDTLSLIAVRKLGNESRWNEIARLNSLQAPYQLFIGQRLKLPQSNSQLTSGILSAPKSNQETPATLALARGFMFVVFEQLPDVGPRKVIRKVAVIPKDFSLLPPNPTANLSIAEHALGNNTSQFLSSSNKPFGAPSIQGKPLMIDLSKAETTGARVFTVEEVVADLNRFANENPATRTRVNQLIWAVQKVEGETLIEGGVPSDAVKRISTAQTPYVKTAEELWAQFQAKKISKAQLESELKALETAYSKAKIFGRVGRVLTVVGIVLTVKDVADATQRSVNRNSYKPLAAETVRQVGGWGGAIAGGKIGFWVGAAFGIETGPGAIITGAIGAIVFGAIGYFAADKLASWIEDDSAIELRKDVRSTDNMQTQGITLIIGSNENQYDFARRALIQAAFKGGLVTTYTQNSFADKFFPLNRSAEEKSKFKINWISGDPNKNDGSDMKGQEWENLRGRIFTYFLKDEQVKELVRKIINPF
jgi:LysM repeat protein/outer membrane lipoprotein SlyB